MKLDAIYRNGRIYTMRADGETIEALGILNGRIVVAGSNADVADYEAEREVDLEGAPVIPGLEDTHMHLYLDMLGRRRVDLGEARSWDDVERLLRAGLDHLEEGMWLTGENMSMAKLAEGAYPPRQVLDRVSTEVPIVAGSFCHHFHSLNTAAITACGLDRDDLGETDGQVPREDDGYPTGVVRDQAYPAFVAEHIPLPTLANNIPAVAEYLRELAGLGLTTLQVYQEDNPDGARLYQEVRRLHGPLMRLGFTWYADRANDRGIVSGFGDEWLKIGPLKYLADGSVGGRTAYLEEPYSDDPTSCGEASFTQDELDEIVRTRYNEGHELCIHAIGDRAISMVLDAFERAYDPEIGDARRLYIGHCTVPPTDFYERIADLPVYPQLSPNWWVNFEHFSHDRLGPEGSERHNRLFPIRDMLDHGVIVQCGSDAPVATVNPWVGIEGAVTRRAVGSDIPQAAAQAVSVYEALRCYTANAAYYNHEEHDKGTLEVGKFADFVQLSADPFTIDSDRLHTITAVRTIVGGHESYGEARDAS
ncbi:amidohydrolase [Nanchangia anserum]|uniref:Amidohydrolase n=1 Tax=Nanchangia anserum TaxID=2692125 RepID=A0A8I0GAS7_9ACTO|nr:amidohydrolase [Nanchangia anserum]MBD3689368.1 amidohydrolase [Nanchangia anserum]QOX81575.1 amidohydrolase [Nanchangia anserum]